jgi:hypothetical protein
VFHRLLCVLRGEEEEEEKKTDFIPMVLIRLSVWHQEKRKRERERERDREEEKSGNDDGRHTNLNSMYVQCYC